MTEGDKAKATTAETDAITAAGGGSLVFISHDGRDADLAEAFSKLLKSVSAGMIKTFRSSDKKGTEGIDFGDEWYKRLMLKLQSTSGVVCLFTERSLDRPWILYEAGVAKGKLNTPVLGLALGVSLSRVGKGPFYQFQNSDDSVEDLTKLVHQLARGIPSLELDADVVKVQVAAFKAMEEQILKELSSHKGKGENEVLEENPIAKLVEEMKALPSRVAERLSEEKEPLRRKRLRRFHPMMFEEMMDMTGGGTDPVGILMAASFVRDDAPWLYELAMDVYRAAKSGDPQAIKCEMGRLHHFSECMMRGPFMEELGIGGREVHMFCMELPRILEHMVQRMLDEKGPTSRHARRPPKVLR